MLIHVPFKIRLLNCIERFHKTISCVSHKKDHILADVCSKKTVYAHIFHGYTVNDVTLKDLN